MERIESVSVGIGPSPHQDVYVSDEKNSRIHRFSAEGTHRGTFRKQGFGPGMFAKEVEGLTFDDFGYLYAVDETGGKIEVFTPDGRSVHSFGGGPGIRPGQFNSPDGIHYSPLYNSILVADQRNHRIQVFHLEDIWKNKKRVSQKPDSRPTGLPAMAAVYDPLVTLKYENRVQGKKPNSPLWKKGGGIFMLRGWP